MSKKILKTLIPLILYAFTSNLIKISAMEIRPEISTKDAPTELDKNKLNKYKKKMKIYVERISKNCKPEYGYNYIKKIFEECKNFIKKPIDILENDDIKIKDDELLEQLKFLKIEINDKKEGLVYENKIKQELIDYLKYLKIFINEKEKELKPYLDISDFEQTEITKEIIFPLKEKIKTINKEIKNLNFNNKKDIKTFKEHASYINKLLNSNYYDDKNNILSSQQIDFKELIKKLKELNTIKNNNYENYYIKKEIKEELENLLKESKKNIVKLKNDNKIDLNISNRIEMPEEAIKKYIKLVKLHENLIINGLKVKSPNVMLFYKKLKNLICLNNFSLDINKLLKNLLKNSIISNITNVNYFINEKAEKDLEQTFKDAETFIKQTTKDYKIKEKKILIENINAYINDLKTKIKELEKIDNNLPDAIKNKNNIFSTINEKLHLNIEDYKIAYETEIIKEIQKSMKKENDENFFYYIDEEDKKYLKTEISNIKNSLKTFNKKNNQDFFQKFSKEMIETLINKLKELEKKVEKIVPDKNIEKSEQKNIVLNYLDKIFELLSLKNFKIDYKLLANNLYGLGYAINQDYFLENPLEKDLENKLKKEIYMAKAFYCEYINLFAILLHAEKDTRKFQIKEIITNQINVADKYTSLFLKNLILYKETPNDETLYKLEETVENIIENTYLTFEKNIAEKEIDKISLFSTVYNALKQDNIKIYYEELENVLTDKFGTSVKSIYQRIYKTIIDEIKKLNETDKYAASTLIKVKDNVEIIHEEEVKKAKEINEMEKYSIKYKISEKEENKKDLKNNIEKIREEINKNIDKKFNNMCDNCINESYSKNFDEFINIFDVFNKKEYDKNNVDEDIKEENYTKSLDEKEIKNNKNKFEKDINNKHIHFENMSNTKIEDKLINSFNILDKKEDKKDNKSKINIKSEDELIDAAPIISSEKNKCLENSTNIVNKINEYNSEEEIKESEAPLPIYNIIEKPNSNQINDDFNILLEKMNPNDISKENYEKLKKLMKMYEQNQNKQDNEKQKNKKQKHKKKKK